MVWQRSPPNQTFIPHWRRSHGLLNQSIEEFGPAAGLASVESEHELVEVIIQMLAGDSTLVGSQRPPLQQGRHRCTRGNRIEAVLPLPLITLAGADIRARQSFVALPSVCDHGGPGTIASCTKAWRLREKQPPPTQQILPMPFLSSWAATTTRALFPVPAASPGLYATHIGFILRPTRRAVTAGPHHHATELVQPSPSRLVTAQSQATLQAQGTDTDLFVRHIPHGWDHVTSGVCVPSKIVPTVGEVCR